ncbi:MAG: thioredoxin domain-containing protein, partial [Pseudomonadota bacterium]|nr:thioredoxin domain-containing protein [Pseudomonadota bacterium]
MPNRLARETSPYLQQHAANPVDWHAWGEESLALARSQNKPILLSIGYSACHWCHVMAHESFEDVETAAIMNELFVNIKVDREERPDLDQIYQTAHYILTQRSGGWPLTMFLTAQDHAPFFGGTYFPKTARHNLPGFKDLLPRIAAFYRERRQEIDVQNASLIDALRRGETSSVPGDATFSPSLLEAAFESLRQSFDPVQGGFGSAPKFPHPTEIEFCFQRYAATGNEDALNVAIITLKKMANGGIYDHLGGGFARYSVDQYWMIPHFEKMLYDNGPLLRLCSDAWLITGDAQFKQVAEETAAWVMREMQSPEGGYYSTIDADSEHEEGKFYVWLAEEVRQRLLPEEYSVAAALYGLDGPANFEGSHWHLRIVRPLAEVARRLGMAEEMVRQHLASARQKLFLEREKRIHPGRDEKILVSWNALMIKGMARAGIVFERKDWIASAQRAVDFVRRVMWKNERLLATYKDGRAHLNAYLDDYAFMLDGLIELMQAEFRSDDLTFAQELADVLLDQFEDKTNGGFYFTSHEHEKLIQRAKPSYDNATPSGNAIAALALQRVAFLTGDLRYSAVAE